MKFKHIKKSEYKTPVCLSIDKDIRDEAYPIIYNMRLNPSIVFEKTLKEIILSSKKESIIKNG